MSESNESLLNDIELEDTDEIDIGEDTYGLDVDKEIQEEKERIVDILKEYQYQQLRNEMLTDAGRRLVSSVIGECIRIVWEE